MCGRFGQIHPTEEYARQLDLPDKHPSLTRRYNITPGLWLLAADWYLKWARTDGAKQPFAIRPADR